MQTNGDVGAPLSDEAARKELIRQQVANTRIQLAPVEEHVDLSRAIKAPLGQIASLGVAFASMPAAFRTVAQNVTLPADGMLMRAFDAMGNPVDISRLNTFNHSFGSLGSMRNPITGDLSQAHFVAAGPQTVQMSIMLPYDPATLAIAIALYQINQKLDAIQKTVDDMFDYMRQRDKSEMRGNLRTLVDALNGYSFNWDNERYLGNAHMKVLDIKQRAMQDIDFYRGRIERKLGEKGLPGLRLFMEKRLDEVLDILKDYQLAVYLYAFASFLDPMLSENYKKERLDDVAERISAESTRYLETYARCYEAIQADAVGSVDTAVLGGLASAGQFLSKAIAATPVGEHTLVDEALEDGGKAIEAFNNDATARLLEKLQTAKSPDVRPFQENVRMVNAIYNESTQLLTDGENLYLVPEEAPVEA